MPNPPGHMILFPICHFHFMCDVYVSMCDLYVSIEMLGYLVVFILCSTSWIELQVQLFSPFKGYSLRQLVVITDWMYALYFT